MILDYFTIYEILNINLVILHLHVTSYIELCYFPPKLFFSSIKSATKSKFRFWPQCIEHCVHIPYLATVNYSSSYPLPQFCRWCRCHTILNTCHDFSKKPSTTSFLMIVAKKNKITRKKKKNLLEKLTKLLS